MGEIWEGYGRDKNNLHYAESPLAKGIPEDDGRDGDYFRPKSAGTSPHFDVSHLMMGLRKVWVRSQFSARWII
jgi:hypothetical protein